MVPTATNREARRLDQLADRMFRLQLELSPIYATDLGYSEYAGQLPDESAEAGERYRSQLTALREEAATIDSSPLDPERQITRLVLLRSIDDTMLGIEAAPLEYTIMPGYGYPASTVIVKFPKTVLRTAEEAEGYIERCVQTPTWLAQSIDRLATGRAEGRHPVSRLVSSAIDQISAYLSTSPHDDPLLSIEPPDGTPAEWRDRLTGVVRDKVRPALARYRDHLATEVRPPARPDGACGLAHLPNGTELYQKLAAKHTTTDHSVEALHRLGLDLVRELTDEMRERGSRTLGTSDFAEIRGRLRSDRDLFFTNAEEMLTTARASLDRAQQALPDWLGAIPRAGCEVREQSVYEAETGNLGYYQWASVDGVRPGTFWLNTHRPETRPRFELETLTFHESVPGHHTQLALLWELPDLSDFRRHARATAFSEGWALYTERLADEMGIYTNELSKLGMVSFDFWRACRLVVDTGMHALGWTRDRAVQFMLDNSALTRKNVQNEIDRYIAWPGQALGYMVGRREIVRLRDRAARGLGSDLSVRDFHTALVTHGSLPLSVLDQVIEEWIETRAR